MGSLFDWITAVSYTHLDVYKRQVMDKSGETEVLKAYPQGEERRAINAVFDEIVADLKLQHTLTHAETTLPLAVQALSLIHIYLRKVSLVKK